MQWGSSPSRGHWPLAAGISRRMLRAPPRPFLAGSRPLAARRRGLLSEFATGVISATTSLLFALPFGRPRLGGVTSPFPLTSSGALTAGGLPRGLAGALWGVQGATTSRCTGSFWHSFWFWCLLRCACLVILGRFGVEGGELSSPFFSASEASAAVPLVITVSALVSVQRPHLSREDLFSAWDGRQLWWKQRSQFLHSTNSAEGDSGWWHVSHTRHRWHFQSYVVTTLAACSDRPRQKGCAQVSHWEQEMSCAGGLRRLSSSAWEHTLHRGSTERRSRTCRSRLLGASPASSDASLEGVCGGVARVEPVVVVALPASPALLATEFLRDWPRVITCGGSISSEPSELVLFS